MASTHDNRGRQFMAENYDPVTIDKWDGNAVKNALNDAVKNLMKSEYEYIENYSLVDQRLFICTVACVFSLFAVLYDYWHPFPKSQYILATCSISYFILMGVLTLFTTYKEKNIFMVAVEKGIAGLGPDNICYVMSALPRYSHMYKLGMKFVDGKTKESSYDFIEKSIAEWFDEEGTLLLELLYNDVNQLHTRVKTKKTN